MVHPVVYPVDERHTLWYTPVDERHTLVYTTRVWEEDLVYTHQGVGPGVYTHPGMGGIPLWAIYVSHTPLGIPHQLVHPAHARRYLRVRAVPGREALGSALRLIKE